MRSNNALYIKTHIHTALTDVSLVLFINKLKTSKGTCQYNTTTKKLILDTFSQVIRKLIQHRITPRQHATRATWAYNGIWKL